MKEPTWNNNVMENGLICLSNAQEIYRINREQAISWVDQAISYFRKNEDSLCNLAQCYYIKAYLLWENDKDTSKALFTESIKTHILGNKNEDFREHKFYKFVTVNTSNIESILHNIRLVHPSNFNDPMDCPIAVDTKNGIPDTSLLNGLRVGCYGVVDEEKKYFLDASKWSYYADSHKGICIEYDFSNLEFKNEYALMGKIKYEAQYRPDRGIVGGSLLTKSNDYEQEDEWRIIWYDELLTSAIPVYINIQPLKIVNIYIGYKCDVSEIQRYIMHFRNQNPHIRVYKIMPSEENFYQLTAKEIQCHD